MAFREFQQEPGHPSVMRRDRIKAYDSIEICDLFIDTYFVGSESLNLEMMILDYDDILSHL